MMPICQRQTKNVTFVAQRLFKSIVIWFVYVTISEQRLMKFGSVQWLIKSTSHSFPRPVTTHDSWNKKVITFEVRVKLTNAIIEPMNSFFNRGKPKWGLDSLYVCSVGMYEIKKMKGKERRDRKINSTVVFREKILDEFLTIQRF